MVERSETLNKVIKREKALSVQKQGWKKIIWEKTWGGKKQKENKRKERKKEKKKDSRKFFFKKSKKDEERKAKTADQHQEKFLICWHKANQEQFCEEEGEK